MDLFRLILGNWLLHGTSRFCMGKLTKRMTKKNGIAIEWSGPKRLGIATVFGLFFWIFLFARLVLVLRDAGELEYFKIYYGHLLVEIYRLRAPNLENSMSMPANFRPKMRYNLPKGRKLTDVCLEFSRTEASNRQISSRSIDCELRTLKI